MQKNYKKLFWISLGIFTIIRFLPAFFTSLVPQEAYYWMYIQKPDLGYFDHPPMCAYLIGIFTNLFGDKEIFVRMGALFFSIFTSLAFFKLTSLYFNDDRKAFSSSLLLQSTIFFNIQSFISTPDTPLLLFWTLTLLYFYKANFIENNWKNWFLTGIFAGLALYSKYSASFLFLSAFLFLLLSDKRRKILFSAKPYLAALTSFIVFSPVIYWNASNHWASFLFQSSTRAKGMKKLTLEYFVQLLGSQFYELAPFLFIAVIVALTLLIKKYFKQRDDKLLFILSFSLPLILFFGGVSFLSLVKMNWIMPAYFTAIMAIVEIFSDKYLINKKLKIAMNIGFISSLVAILANLAIMLFPIAPIKHGDTWTGWKEMAAKVVEIKSDMEKRNKTFVFSNEYKIPAELTFYSSLRNDILAQNVYGEPALQFDFWQNPNNYIGWDGILVFADFMSLREPDRLYAYFDKIEKIEPLEIKHNGKLFRKFTIWKCYGYKGSAIKENHEIQTQIE